MSEPLPVGIHYDYPEALYHADPCDTPSLSNSTAHYLCDHSAAHVQAFHPRLGGLKKEVSSSTQAAYDGGNLIHSLVLGTGDIQVLDHDSLRTKQSKEEAALARFDGKTPVLKDKHDAAQGVAEIIKSKLKSRGFKLQGKSEVTAVWEDDGVLCRGRMDHVDGNIILDLKTTKDANPEKIKRSIVDYGYASQRWAYLDAMEKLTGEKHDFVFAFCELTAPYVITIATFTESMKEYGRLRWKRGRNVWKRCLDRNHWPEYDDLRPIPIDCPPWAMSRELEQEEHDDE